MNSIEDVVKDAIIKRGMTFKTFSERVGLSDVAIRNIFKRNDCRISDIRKMGEVLNINMCGLICDEHEIQRDSYSDEISALKTEIGYLKEILKLKDEILKQNEGSN